VGVFYGHQDWFCKPVKRSKLPGRRGFAPDPTAEFTATFPRPLAGGEGNIPSPRTPPFKLRSSALTISVDHHNVVDGSEPMTPGPVSTGMGNRLRAGKPATQANSAFHPQRDGK